MSLASNFQSVADRLLDKFDERPSGSKILEKQPGAKVWDPILGEYVFSAGTETEVTGVVTVYKKELVDGNTIQAGDLLLKLKRNANPAPDSKYVIDGIEYSVVSIDPSSYTGSALNILYSVQVRR